MPPRSKPKPTQPLDLSVWSFTVRLPKDVNAERTGRFLARLLKHLLRRWSVRVIHLDPNPPETEP
jgi:hypothetical protein